ncbi:MAG: cytochrome-c peroxidase [Massilia sp.]|nr:cytochrome-c peroxidase [Massilia sp.]
MQYTLILQKKGVFQQCAVCRRIGRGSIARSAPLSRQRDLVPQRLYKPRRPLLFAAIPIGIAAMLGLGVYPSLVAQTTGPTPTLSSLKTVPVPGPSEAELGAFVRDKKAAIQLGKALFWDVKVGSDNRTACASCHFQAGADNRITNQISPGLLSGDRTFQLGGPNHTLKVSDFPLTKHAALDERATRMGDVNDIISSQGVFRSDFVGAGTLGATDRCSALSDALGNGGFGFHRDALNTRRVEPRNAPTVINAVFNFRNFWDGRSNNVFNGVDPFGMRNANALIWQEQNGLLRQVAATLPSSSLASQASGPPLSAIEMSCNGRPFVALAKKLLPLKPLSTQQIDQRDSVLSGLSDNTARGQTTYQALIKAAFQPTYWQSATPVTLSSANQQSPGNMDLIRHPKRNFDSMQVSQMEANFSLFFGLALQMYQATLVSDNAPYDQFAEGQNNALTLQQRSGLAIFQGQGKCINCHTGAETTNASFQSVVAKRLERMMMTDAGKAIYDTGFYNIGVRPTAEDFGVGGVDPFGFPFSETRMSQMGRADLLGSSFNAALYPAVQPNERLAVDGAFKTPTLRNVELTGPYMHNGGKSTLMQVVDFYNRGGDFAVENKANVPPDITPLGLTQSQKDDLVAFLLALTDDRVKFRKAPFDHPALCVPVGHKQDAAGKLVAEVGNALQAADASYQCLPAVGAGGSATALKPFMQLNPATR